MARQCTKPKWPKNSEWFKEKMLLAQSLEARVVLDEEQIAFLADGGTEDLDAFNSDYDEAPSASAILMAKLSAYDSDVLLEVPNLDTYQNNNEIDQGVQKMQYFEQPPFINESDIDITSDIRTKAAGQNEGTREFEHIRKAFEKDVIPFIKSLKEYFPTFDQGIFKEITDMKEVFNQMETQVEKCFIKRKYFEIEKKELFIENDRLLEQIQFQDIMCIVLHANLDNKCVVPANDDNLAYAKMEPTQLQKKNTTISNLKDDTATLKGKSVSDCTVPVNNFNVLALGIYKLDMEPLSPKLRKNKEVHVDYFKQIKEHADTLRDIVEQSRAL
ncbi:hypothetical protein Tco_1074086 [Tanacetum coccineum]